MRALFYVDSAAMLPSAVATAQLLVAARHAEIVMMLVDSGRYYNESLKGFYVCDHAMLYQLEFDFAEVSGKALPDMRAQKFQLRFVHLPGVRRALRHAVVTIRAMKLWRAPARAVRAIRKQRAMQLWRAPARAVLAILAVLTILEHGAMKFWRALHAALGRENQRHRSRFQKIVLRALLTILAFPVVQGFYRALRWRRAVANVGTFIGTIRPDIILVQEDNIQTLSRAFVEQGRRQGIPSVIVPYTIPNPQEPAQYYYNAPEQQAVGWLRWLFLRWRPKWGYTFRGRKLLIVPLPRALAIELMGFSVPNPWHLNSGSAAAIAIESEAMKSVYLKLGFPPEQLRVIGEPAGAALYAGRVHRADLRQKIVAEHRFRDDCPLVVCGFPPDQYQGSNTEAFEFVGFPALMEAWIGAFRTLGEGANIVIRPHPRLNPEILRRYETSRIKVSVRPTSTLIPVCDLYVACISATIRWAIACGIPVINYDCCRYYYADFEHAPGVLTVHHLNEFRTLLKRFVDEPGFASELRQKQEASMRDWGQVDDGFPDRFIAMLDDVIGAARAKLGAAAPSVQPPRQC